LIRIAFDALAGWTVHGGPWGCGDVDADLLRIVDPDFVFDDFRIEPGVAEFLRDIVGGGFIFGSARHVRSLGQNAQVLFGQFWVWNG
jgi:hypothetical protein